MFQVTEIESLMGELNDWLSTNCKNTDGRFHKPVIHTGQRSAYCCDTGVINLQMSRTLLSHLWDNMCPRRRSATITRSEMIIINLIVKWMGMEGGKEVKRLITFMRFVTETSGA